MSDTPVLCINCKFIKYKMPYGASCTAHEKWVEEKDLVTGNMLKYNTTTIHPAHINPYKERGLVSSKSCGPEGKLFQPLPIKKLTLFQRLFWGKL